MTDRDASPHVIGGAGAVIRDDAGRLLLVQRAHDPNAGAWSIPGGKCEPGEDPRDACGREVAEETGLVVEVGPAIGRVLLPGPRDGTTYDVSDFDCVVIGGQLVAGDDAAAVAWVDFDGLARLPLVPGLLDALRAWDRLPR